MVKLKLNLLGSFRVTLNGEPITAFESDKVRALLAYLALEADRPHRREKLAGLIWPNWPEKSARQNLSGALHHLRAAIGDRDADPPFLIISRPTLQFNRESDYWLDAAAFAHHLAACDEHDHPRPETCAPCCERLREAAALYQGGFIEGFSLPDSASFEEWLRVTREQLHRQALEAFHALSECYEAQGEINQALEQSRRAVELDPCWEKGQRSIMRLLALGGQTSAALAQYDRFEQLLDVELGVAPSAETRELRDLLRKGRRPPALLPPTTIAERAPRSVGACPYRGLAAFRQHDAPFFFGREAFVERLVDAIQTRPLVAVIVGSSGSGKSSVVHAGLLPRLGDSADWSVATARPGSEPFQATAAALLPLIEPDLGAADRLIETRKLAAAIRAGDLPLIDLAQAASERAGVSRLLLLVDQFEELYTLCPDPDVQHRFVDELLAAAEKNGSPLTLLLTLRADFMGQALAHRPFADALQEGAVMMGPMDSDELRAAVVKPAEVQGAAFEEGLVERILDDIGQEPGNLPLLEFALTLLWEAHDHGWLTHAAYDATGRVEGALAHYADEVYDALDETDRDRARHILIQLVRPGEETADTRRLATRAELGEESWALVTHLADRRLVVTGRDAATGADIVEVVHEALIQRWDRMRGWMDVDRAFRTWQERLRAALRAWQASERDEGALLRGAPLGEAEAWLAEREGELSAAETEFIQAGVGLREKRQAERDRRRRRTTWALAAGLALALALVVFASQQWLRAEDESQEARRQASIGLAAQALADLESGSPVRAALLALEALEHYPYTSQAESALARVVQEYSPPRELGMIMPTWSPDGERIAIYPPPVGDHGIAFAILDAASGNVLNETIISTVPACLPYRMTWSPSGDQLAVSTRQSADVDCPPPSVWHLPSGTLSFSLSPDLGYGVEVAWAPDGSALFAGGDDGLLQVWDTETGVQRSATPAHSGRIYCMAISPAGDRLATASADGDVKLWDVPALLSESHQADTEVKPDPGAEMLTLSGHADIVYSVTWSPAGDRLASASEDGTVRVWALPKNGVSEATTAEAQVLLSISGHSGPVASVAWSPDGRQIATLGADGTVRTWEPTTGRELFSQATYYYSVGISDKSPEVIWSPAGELVMRIRGANSLAWDTSRRKLQLVGHAAPAQAARWSPDGSRIATSAADGVRIWDGASGEELLQISAPGAFYLAWSPDGTRVTSGLWDGRAVVWDAVTGEMEMEFPFPPEQMPVTISWSPDGSRIAVSEWPTFVMYIVDAASGEILTTFGEQGCLLFDPSWSPDSALIATGCSFQDEEIYPGGHTPARIWDAATGELLLTLESEDKESWKAVWSPDGQRLAVAHRCMNEGFGVGSAPEQGRTVKVWAITADEETGLAAEELLTYTGHSEGLGEVRWSPDGNRIASGDEGGMVRIWDAATGVELFSAQMPPHVYNIDWTPDGKRLVAAGAFDPVVMQVWSSTEDLIDYAYDCCVTRELTAEEREQLGLPPAQDD